MRRRLFVAPAVAAFGIFVGCAADAPVSPLPVLPVLSGPRLAEQGRLAAMLFDEEVLVTRRALPAGGLTTSTGDWRFVLRADLAWLASVVAAMDVARSRTASGSFVAERDARVLGALAYRAWLSTKVLIDAAELRAAPVVAKLRLASTQELETVRGALEEPSFTLTAFLAKGTVERMEDVARIEQALRSAAHARREGVSAIPIEVSVAASVAASRAVGRLVVDGPTFRPNGQAQNLREVATIEGLLGLPASKEALRVVVTSRAEAPLEIVAPRFLALFASRDSVEVVLPPASPLTVAEARAVLGEPDPSPVSLVAANDTLLRAAFTWLAEPLGAVAVADGTLKVRVPTRILQAVLDDLRGSSFIETLDLGAVDTVLASDCFGAQTSSHDAIPGSLAFDARVDSCKDARCTSSIDVVAPRARAACDSCMVRACSIACMVNGESVALSAAHCARCDRCDDLACMRDPSPPPSDGVYCGRAQAGCWFSQEKCYATCRRETVAAGGLVQCMRSACADECAQE